ncbi:MAG: hypothetical protein DRO90_01695 [Candidatus Altiarchaeales archaeon]|nr:MAG: hypothetical protein DRO95_06410 [Candidatus Altiarchaeales archaeon]RLI94641.1 MAG: hypothetical protein DRO90_01695 [Candidatus Altiarchaeales archaeon]HDO82829.1 hypothetical protein [Candidatus Altiarchaeales archaeon]HEX55478.1 hypothetical protein [Candidatus Altiarchaeales archaeon]
MYIIIIGGGTTATALAKHLASEDHEIVIVEKDDERAKLLAESMDALVIRGDGSDTEILKDAGIERADAVVILTRDDNTNLTICQIVKKFNVKRIVARVNDPGKQDLYLGLEITAAINPTAAIVSYLKNAITQGSERSIISIEKGKAEIIQMKLTNEKLFGRKIKDINLPNDAIIGLISRGGEVIIGSPNVVLLEGDLLTIITKTEASKDVITLLKG